MRSSIPQASLDAVLSVASGSSFNRADGRRGDPPKRLPVTPDLEKIRALGIAQLFAILILGGREKEVIVAADLNPFTAGQNQRVRRRLFTQLLLVQLN